MIRTPRELALEDENFVAERERLSVGDRTAVEHRRELRGFIELPIGGALC